MSSTQVHSLFLPPGYPAATVGASAEKNAASMISFPVGPSSPARHRMPGSLIPALVLDILITLPLVALNVPRQACVMSTGPVRSVSTLLFHSSSVICSSDSPHMPPVYAASRISDAFHRLHSAGSKCSPRVRDCDKRPDACCSSLSL